jgi:hypothetical protein
MSRKGSVGLVLHKLHYNIRNRNDSIGLYKSLFIEALGYMSPYYLSKAYITNNV